MVAEGKAPLNTLHPLAWWGWAIGVGLAVSFTTNPLPLSLIAAAVVAVVLLRRSAAPWARSVKAYLLLSLMVIGIRVFFQILIGASGGDTVLFTLPEIPLPDWAAGIRLGGEVTAEALAHTIYDALRLAVLLLCIGAANALANPRQALRSVPAALYEASTSVVIALSVAPQLIESGFRVRRARRLRGDQVRGLRALGRIAIPVLEDAIERSLSLAAGMDSRGFGRTNGSRSRRALALMLSAVTVATIGAYLVLATNRLLLAVTLLSLGLLGAGYGLRAAGARLQVTRYRPHPWTPRAWAVLVTGMLVAAVLLVVGSLDPTGELLTPSTDPLTWPDLTWPMLLAVALVLAPLPVTIPRRPQPAPTLQVSRRLRPLRAQVET